MNRPCVFAVLLAAALSSSCRVGDRVDAEFGWMLDAGIVNGEWKEQSRRKDWYRRYRVDDAAMTELLGMDLSQSDYKGWAKWNVTGHAFKFGCMLSDRDEVYANYKDADGKPNGVAIFVLKSRREVVLFHGRTWGV